MNASSASSFPVSSSNMMYSAGYELSVADFSSWLCPPFAFRKVDSSIARENLARAQRTQKNHGSDASVAEMSGIPGFYRRLLTGGALPAQAPKAFILLFSHALPTPPGLFDIYTPARA